MESKESSKKKNTWKEVTKWHYLAAFLGALFFVMFFIFFKQEERLNKLTKEKETELRKHSENCLDLYDSMQVWRPIVKQARKK